MLLSYTEICELLDRGIIKHSSYDHVNSASLDITVGSTVLEELDGSQVSYLKNKKGPLTRAMSMPYLLAPGAFILAHSREVFHLPNNISAEYKLKSSMARIGLEHLNAGWCDAGWNGSVLTLELKNMSRHTIIGLDTGDKIGQIVFFKHTPVPADKSYAVRGRYNGDKSAQGAKA